MTDESRLTDVTLAAGRTTKVRLVDGQVFVCRGCCCGNTEKGFPAVPLDEFKAQWKARELKKRIHLTVTGCLGPCAAANVVLLMFGGRAVWLHSIDRAEHVTAIYDYLEGMLATGEYVAPSGILAARHFERYVAENDAEACCADSRAA